MSSLSQKNNLFKIAEKLDYNAIEKILLFNYNDVVKNNELIEYIYGTALFHANIRIISLINLFVKENNIIINQNNILKNIYYAKNKYCQNNSKKYSKHISTREDLPNYLSFDEANKISQYEYIHKYWNMFDIK